MIKTITLLGAGKTGSELALAFAEAAPDGYLVEVFDPNKAANQNIRSQIKQRKLSPDTVWFSQTAERAAWGSDVVLVDLPSTKILPVVKEILAAPNDTAVIALINPPAAKTMKALHEILKESSLNLIAPNEDRLKDLWVKAGITLPAQSILLSPTAQSVLNFDKN